MIKIKLLLFFIVFVFGNLSVAQDTAWISIKKKNVTNNTNQYEYISCSNIFHIPEVNERSLNWFMYETSKDSLFMCVTSENDTCISGFSTKGKVKKDVQILREEKNILGFVCRKAIIIESVFKKDIVSVVWITNDKRLEPYFHKKTTGINGLVLESDDGTNKFITESIDFGTQPPVEYAQYLAFPRCSFNLPSYVKPYADDAIKEAKDKLIKN